MSSLPIAEETVEQVQVLLRGRVRDLRVVLREDRVVLLGNAANYYAKQLAQHYVLKVLGAAVLVNEIEVRGVRPTPDTDNPAPD
jgi:hypothetical protein